MPFWVGPRNIFSGAGGDSPTGRDKFLEGGNRTVQSNVEREYVVLQYGCGIPAAE